MILIEDKTTKGYKNLVEDALKFVFQFIPEEDLKGVEKIILLDECQDDEYKWAGGFYYAAHEGRDAVIELYPPKIIDAKPFFIPRSKFSNAYSIAKMFLHELGHHQFGVENLEGREFKAQEYMLLYIKKIYGNWIYFFDFLARVNDFLIQIALKTRRARKKPAEFREFPGHDT